MYGGLARLVRLFLPDLKFGTRMWQTPASFPFPFPFPIEGALFPGPELGSVLRFPGLPVRSWTSSPGFTSQMDVGESLQERTDVMEDLPSLLCSITAMGKVSKA